MTAGSIPTVSCDHTDETGSNCDQEWYAPVSMPHHRALPSLAARTGMAQTP
ncbi:hypothetical protein AB0O22_17620 [Streptomyces sp. NPDC091204]|uniref:hypothetical protein n=1 Tax=Streptomyces sp. NPDC091204 TaxID=3155299 RepID=UPI00342EB8E1